MPIVVAIASQSFRVFGLSSSAWRDAKHGDAGLHQQQQQQQQQQERIVQAIQTAFEADAGGFGSVGGHRHQISNLHLLPTPNSNNITSIIYRADLIPCDEEGVPIQEHGAVDDDHDNNTSSSPFQIQIIVSPAAHAIPNKKLRERLYARGRRLMMGDVANNGDELEDADDANNANQEHVHFHDNSHQGYHVEILLIKPNIHKDIEEQDEDNAEVVFSPPEELNKMALSYRPLVHNNEMSFNHNNNHNNININQENIHQQIYTLPQFTQPSSPREEMNLKVFRLIVLDLQKALVRIEFPKFREGCGDKTFREVYQLNAKLKSGSFATVCRGTHRATNEKVAVKCVLREDLPPNDDAAIYNEVLILSTLKHPLICPLIDFFEEKECYFLVMELMAGGDLFDRIGKRKNYNEKDAMTLCKKMVESVCFCHENSVAHRDMKPKNLLVDEDDDCAIKLADFGFAARVYEPCSLTKQCGTPFFIAPEVLLRQPYDERADMWSVGVITYLLLSGDLPFMGRTQKELFQNIVRGDFSFPEEQWATVSKEAKDLLRKLLVTDPSQRLTSKEAMRSRWFVQRSDRIARTSLLHASIRLKTFNARMKLKSAMIAVRAVSSAQLNTRSKSLAEIVPLEDDGGESSSAEEEVDEDDGEESSSAEEEVDVER